MAFTQPHLQRIPARTPHRARRSRSVVIRWSWAIEVIRGIPRSALWIVPYGAHGPIFGPNPAPFVSAALARLSANRQAELRPLRVLRRLKFIRLLSRPAHSTPDPEKTFHGSIRQCEGCHEHMRSLSSLDEFRGDPVVCPGLLGGHDPLQ
jgi:hypothetical protein